MRAKYRSREEQMNLVMECRTSGLSDYQWCEQNEISNSTFYNWITRLRKAGCQFPESKNINHSVPAKQEIVKVEVLSKELKSPTLIEEQNTRTSKVSVAKSDANPAVEIQISDTTIRFFNNTSPEIIKYTLECFGGDTHAW